MFRSLLIPVDLSPSADRVIGRAALLPLAEKAHLTLLHVIPGGLPARDLARAQSDATRALDAEVASLEETLPRGVTIERLLRVGNPAVEIVRRIDAARVELVVMGRGGGKAMRDVFLGSTAERVLRQTRLPVLVVRLKPRGPYRRPAIALEVDQPASGLLEVLLRVVPPPRPTVEVIHAYDAPYTGMIYPSLAPEDVDEYRDHFRRRAESALDRLLAAALAEAKLEVADAPAWKTHLRLGSPRLVIERAVHKAATDLLTLGTRGHRGLAQAFLGSVSGDVLRAVGCDVLVVPPREPRAKKG